MNLVNSKHYASEEIQRLIKQLDTTKLSLNGAWDKRYHLLTQCHDLQVCPQPTPLCYQSSQPASLLSVLSASPSVISSLRQPIFVISNLSQPLCYQSS